MKYICRCGKLMNEADVFAFDGENYYCSIDCYHDDWDEPDIETDDEPETIQALTGAIEETKHWWQR